MQIGQGRVSQPTRQTDRVAAVIYSKDNDIDQKNFESFNSRGAQISLDKIKNSKRNILSILGNEDRN